MLGGNAGGGSLLGTLGPMVIGGVLKSMMGGGRSGGGGGLGGMLGSLLGGGAKTEQQFTDDERNEVDDQATLLLRAMINAVKSDGQVDRDELDNITSKLGEIDEGEKAFLQAEFKAPLDLAAFVATVPEELAQQVYAFSLLGIKVDTNREAAYLRALAQGLALSDNIVDQIHKKFDEPDITG